MAAPVVVVVTANLGTEMAQLIARIVGTGESQQAEITVVHVARVWGNSLGLQHPALQPNAAERANAQEIATQAVQMLRDIGVTADALVLASRDAGKMVAEAARRRGAGTIIVERNDTGRIDRILRGPDLARALLDRTTCTIIAVGSPEQPR